MNRSVLKERVARQLDVSRKTQTESLSVGFICILSNNVALMIVNDSNDAFVGNCCIV